MSRSPPPSNGTVTGLAAGGSYVSSTAANLTAVPAEGYALVSWTVNDIPAGSTNPLILNVNGNKAVVANFGPNNTSTVNGFTVYEEYRIGLLVASLSGLKVGDVVGPGGTFPAIDLSFLTLRTTAPAQTLSIAGLPTGLVYIPNTDKTKGGIIVGTVTGELGAAGVDINRATAAITTGGVTTPSSTVSFPFNIHVLPFPYAGSYEALIENAGTPVGKARVTINALTTPLINGVKVPTVSFSASLETQGVVRTTVAPAIGDVPTTVKSQEGRLIGWL